MKCIEHTLPGGIPGARFCFHSYHFGDAGSRGPHVYLQAGLHADELPGVLLLHRLRKRLMVLEAEGKLTGQVTLVPMCNPQGMAQHWGGQHHGRFESGSGENFNRHYPDISRCAAELMAREDMNPRSALLAALAALPRNNPLDHLRQTLMEMALRADMVLDVHCDSEASLHLYGNHRHTAQATELAGFLQAGATLLCDEAGGMSFDDAVVQNWRRLEQHLGRSLQIPFAVTVELRGVTDVEDRFAARDEGGLQAWLVTQGVLAGEPVTVPQPPFPATPLEGVECVVAPQGGIVVYQLPFGQWLPAGSRLGYVLDPLTGETSPLNTHNDGFYYARVTGRLVTAGTEVAFIATPTPLRNGMLLCA